MRAELLRQGCRVLSVIIAFVAAAVLVGLARTFQQCVGLSFSYKFTP